MRVIKTAGDTIVEVLIAMVVLSVLLAGAHITTNRAQNSNQDAQERTAGIKVVQSQLESLKALLADGDAIPGSATFCIKSDSSDFEPIITPTDPFSQNIDAATLPYSGDCGNINGLYNIAIKFNATTSTYIIINRWNRIGGGRDEIRMYYRTPTASLEVETKMMNEIGRMYEIA